MLCFCAFKDGMELVAADNRDRGENQRRSFDSLSGGMHTKHFCNVGCQGQG